MIKNKYEIKVKINYCFQMKQNYIRIFTTNHWIKKKMIKKTDYINLKFIVNNSGIETDFSD